MSKSKSKNKAQELKALRHTAEHVLTKAMINLFGREKVIMAMGPATDEGFYFDFDTPAEFNITPDNLSVIEKEMKKLIKADLIMENVFVNPETAKMIFADNDYKLEWLNEIQAKGEKVSLYLMGSKEDLEHDIELIENSKKLDITKLNSFIDLCSGPHVQSTKEIKAFKLLSVAGAYWRGDENNKMLTRIYGTAFDDKKDLKDFLWKKKEAKKRDHRKLGQKLELFMIDEEVGQGLIMWLPNGARLLNNVKDFAFNTYLENGYEPVFSPHIGSSALWKHSGHLDFYQENMYSSFGVEDEKYLVKPMNCPFHVKMYQHRPRSYRELPIRWTEMGTVYRYEKSGVLHGLTRVRGFTQDDAHIVCTKQQLGEEIEKALSLTMEIYKAFDLTDYEINISTLDLDKREKFIGEKEDWEKAQDYLLDAVKNAGLDNYVYDLGGAAFYGPKIDIKFYDSLGREWQLSTIQVDFNLPKRFKMTYIGDDGQEHVPFMIHRALLGSLERFLGIYIEHTGGNFPAWVAPLQVKILPIADRHHEYARQVEEKLKQHKIRVSIDERSESLSSKIRDAQLEKVPFMLIVGDKEQDSNQVNVRNRDKKKQKTVKLDNFIEDLLQQIKDKK